jgi:hypothetical protein
MAQPPGIDTFAWPARDQRRYHPEARPHARDELIGRGGVDDVGGRDVQRLAIILGLARALAAHHDVDAMVAEDALQERHIRQSRHVLENKRIVGQQARDHQRQRGVLGARDRDRAIELAAAADANSIHCPSLLPSCDQLVPTQPVPRSDST